MDKATMKQINDHVWMIRDEHNDTCYLVTGKEKAAMIDTMSGYLDVKELAETVTDLPLIVVNTHGHGDHVLGNVSFEKAYIHPADLPMINEMMSDPEVIAALESQDLVMSPFATVENGDVLDLGGLTLEILDLPGHTPGGICVLLREDRILFTGDSINRHLWMQLDGCSTLKEYGEQLDRIAPVRERADMILHGHAQGPEDISLLDSMRKGIAQIVDGQTENDQDYHWFGGVSHQHVYEKDSLIVYGDNIR